MILEPEASASKRELARTKILGALSRFTESDLQWGGPGICVLTSSLGDSSTRYRLAATGLNTPS